MYLEDIFFSCVCLILFFIFKSSVKVCFEDIIMRVILKAIYASFLKKMSDFIYEYCAL